MVAVGFSAGGPSVIDLALRYPSRVSGLVLLSARLPGLLKPNLKLKPILHFVFGADRFFWVYKQLMPKTYAQMMGVPKTYDMSTADHDVFDPIAQSFFPLKPRQEGATFDGFISNPAVDRLPLEDISMPVLLVHSTDDPLALYTSAVAAARRIPQVDFVTMPAGGHLFLGHTTEVRHRVERFIELITSDQRVPV